MQQANKQQAFLALDAFAQSNVSLCEAMIKAGFPTVEDSRVVVIEWAAARSGCPLVKSEHHLSKTPMILDKTHAAFEAARKAVFRAMQALQGEAKPVSRKSEPKPTIAARTAKGFEDYVLGLGLSKAELRVLFTQTLDGLR